MSKDSSWDSKGLWAPYKPGPGAPWNLRRAVHLHRRAAFAATWAELQRDLKDGPSKSIDRLLAGKARSEGVAEDFALVADTLATRAAPPSVRPVGAPVALQPPD